MAERPKVLTFEEEIECRVVRVGFVMNPGDVIDPYQVEEAGTLFRVDLVQSDPESFDVATVSVTLPRDQLDFYPLGGVAVVAIRPKLASQKKGVRERIEAFKAAREIVSERVSKAQSEKLPFDPFEGEDGQALARQSLALAEELIGSWDLT